MELALTLKLTRDMDSEKTERHWLEIVGIEYDGANKLWVKRSKAHDYKRWTHLLADDDETYPSMMAAALACVAAVASVNDSGPHNLLHAGYGPGAEYPMS